MRRVVPLLIVVCLGFAPAPVYREKPDTSKGDLEKMQGKWALVRQTLNGKYHEPLRDYTVEIVGDRFRHYLGARMFGESSIRLNATKRIKEIDREEASGATGGTTLVLGIYRLDGDSLQIAYIDGGRGRPSDFDGNGHGGATFISSVLKRVKK